MARASTGGNSTTRPWRLMSSRLEVEDAQDEGVAPGVARRTLDCSTKQSAENEEEEEEEEGRVQQESSLGKEMKKMNKRIGRVAKVANSCVPVLYLISIMIPCLATTATTGTTATWAKNSGSQVGANSSAQLARHARAAILVASKSQDEGTEARPGAAAAGSQPLGGHSHSNRSFQESAFDSSVERSDEEDDLLQEDEYKRRLIDASVPPTDFSGGPVGLGPAGESSDGLRDGPPANRSDPQKRRQQQQAGGGSGELVAGSRARWPEGDEENEDTRQVAATNQQQLGQSSGGASLLTSFFSHIDKQWKFAEIVLIIAISAILNLVTIIGNIMVLISFKMDRS